MSDETFESIKNLAQEAISHRWLLAIAYTLISISVLAFGIRWPEDYVSAVTIKAENDTVINPIMAGTAVATDVGEYTTIANDILFSRRMMKRILESQIGENFQLTPKQYEKAITNIQDRTTITKEGPNFQVISYKDNSPEKARDTAQLMAELYIGESVQLKIREATSAFQFLEKQIEEYQTKVREAETRLRAWRSSNTDILASLEMEAGQSSSDLLSQIEATENELTNAKLVADSLRKQLAGESKLLALEDPYNKHLADLESRLAALQARYHDSYPDIIQLKLEIEDVKNSIAQNKTADDYRRPIGGQSLVNPLERELKMKLFSIESDMLIKQNKLAILEEKRQNNIANSAILNGARTTHSELKKDVEVNFSIYQELRSKKEQARLTLNLDLEGQGETLAIYEPANLPVTPVGLSHVHFVVASQALGLGLPLGLLFLGLSLNNRIRSERIIRDELGLPFAVGIPHIATSLESRIRGISTFGLVALLALNLGLAFKQEFTLAMSSYIDKLPFVSASLNRAVETAYSLL